MGRYLPAEDARYRLAPATAIGLVVLNLLAGREPLYGLGEWAARYEAATLGLAQTDLEQINDDRVGRALERLFDADRASLLTELVLGVITEFGIDTTDIAAVEALATRLAGPKCRLKTRVAVTEAATAALDAAGASRWVRATIGETVEESFRQERRGRPGQHTRYRRRTHTRYTISWELDPDRVAYDAASDGCFPLISTGRTHTCVTRCSEDPGAGGQVNDSGGSATDPYR